MRVFQHSDPTLRTGPRRSAATAGYALAGVLVLVFVCAIIGSAYLSMAGHETRASQSQLDSQRAFWLAEAGSERAMSYLDNLSHPPESDLTVYTNEPGPTVPGLNHRGSYTVDIVVDTLGAYAVEKQFMIQSLGRFAGKERRVHQRVKMTSFGQYAYFTDEESSPSGDAIWFITGDRIEGRTHSNGTLRIQGNPVFLGPLTSAADRMIGYRSSSWGHYTVRDVAGWPCGINHPTFAEGFSLNRADIPMPTETSDLRSMATSGGLLLANATDIEIGYRATGAAEAGWLRHRRTGTSGAWAEQRVSLIGSRVIYGNQDLRLKGVLDGELTIASRRSIWLIDDLTYRASNASGTPLPGCDDLLGLVAERDIVIANSSATNNLKVNAVMMALNTSVYADRYDNGVLRGRLTIWGGLIQKYRGPVGKHNSSGAATSGYIKDYHYDERVTARTPPGFPLTGVYEKIAWTESWDDSYPF